MKLNKHLLIAFLISLFVLYVSSRELIHYGEHIAFTKAEINGAKVLPAFEELLLNTLYLEYYNVHPKQNNHVQKALEKEFLDSLHKLKDISSKHGFKQYALLDTIEQSFYKKPQTYQDIIEQEIKILDDISNQSNLILDPQLQTYYLMESVIQTLPRLSIDLVMFRNKLSKTDKKSNNRLLMEYGKLLTSVNAVDDSLQYIVKFNPTLDSSMQQQYHEYRQKLAEIRYEIEKISNSKGPDAVNPTFIDEMFLRTLSLYKANNALLLVLLQERLKEYEYDKNIIIISTVFFFIIIVFLLYYLFKNEKIAKHNAFLAYHDQLTMLPNSYAFNRDLKEFAPVGMLLIDIKKFSHINDFYGEDIGDKVLQQFAEVLREITQEYGCKIYRVSADQFITLNLSDHQGLCQKVAKKIFKTFSTPIIKIKEKDMMPISLKVRIAKVLINSVKDKMTCRIKADTALNYAKKKHKDYITYDENLKLVEKIQHELEVVEMVRQAIMDNRVVPVFQKIQKDGYDSYEALIRIRDKETGELISPAAFLDTVSFTPYYSQLTKIMIHKSFEYFSKRDEEFSINFSFADITEKSTIKYLLNMLHKYKMQNRLIIELLETESLQNIETVKNFISKVRSHGIKIAIDDFGSGYSNFIYLAEIDPDYIKIDGSIIKNIDSDEKSYIIAKHICNFAKEIGCKTIAEFVHSKEVAECVDKLAIDGKQGYYIAKPLENIEEN